MIFVPYRLRQSLICLSATFAVITPTCLKETIEWIGANIQLGRYVLKQNLEEKLRRKSRYRRVDWRKACCVFSGGGETVLEEDVKYVLKRVTFRKIEYWRKKVTRMREKMLRHHNKVVKMLKNDQEALGEVMNLKLLVVREEWNKHVVEMQGKMKWLLEEGTVDLKRKVSAVSGRTDEFLWASSGQSYEEENSVKYGEVILDDEENAALSLPPKFAVQEEIDVDETELEVRRTGVMMRWSQREKEERGDNYDEEQEILDSSYWVKGLETVDFSKMRVTNLMGNRRFIIPGPVKNGCFELK